MSIGAFSIGVALAVGTAIPALVGTPLSVARWYGAALAVLLLLAGVGIAAWLGGHITRSLGHLAAIAEDIAAGNLEHRAEESTEHDFAPLAQAFNLMVDSLQRARDELADANATLEQRVDRRTAQVQEALHQLEIAKDAAEAANRMKSDFLATMSHEVRTPMNGVLGTLSLVLDTELSAEQRRLLGLSKSSADALLVIINDILDLSKIEAGRMELSAAPFSMRQICDTVLAMLGSRAKEKRLPLTFDVAADVPAWLSGDEGRIRQVLINLCGNAIKFTERGKVTVTVAAKAVDVSHATLLVEVADTGIGIDEQTQARLFRKFVQADASMSRRYGGTGLGLAISRNLVELMGGSLGVRSEPGRGSIFFFEVRLPTATAPDDKDTGAPIGTARPGSGAYRSVAAGAGIIGPRRLLVVDDNPVNLTVASAMLKNFGHSVDLARDGSEAVAKARARAYDAIFMDLQMPVMDGVEATLAIRKSDGPNRSTPIVALTASAMEADRLSALAAGMNDHVTKPISPDSLRKAVERWCPAPLLHDS